jgi:hypothetical protein
MQKVGCGVAWGGELEKKWIIYYRKDSDHSKIFKIIVGNLLVVQVSKAFSFAIGYFKKRYALKNLHLIHCHIAF